MVSHYDSAMSRTAIFEAHKAWGLSMASRVPRRNRPFANDRHPARRLKIGYVSADFREHPVGFFFESVAMSHDRAAVSVTLYSAVKVPDATTDCLRGAADQWRSVVGLSDEDAAKAIENDGIDILVDLAGHTAGNRLGIFAYRPAPVQATWIGYPDTTGLAAIDWRITDAICDPPAEADAYAVERLMRLPEGFLCFRPPPEAPEVVERSPNLPITFGSFNAFQKLAPETIALWAAVLESVADSRLIVKAGSLGEEETRERFVRTFSAHGIAPERLILFGFKQGRDNHLAAYGDVDIALDPTPYNGTTTTMEALWMGCPVITLKIGRAHV